MTTKRIYERTFFVSNLGTSCQVYPRGRDAYYISSLKTEAHLVNKGHASALLARLRKFADKTGKRLLLQAGPYGHKSIPDLASLKAFYIKNGFHPVGNYDDMEYVP